MKLKISVWTILLIILTIYITNQAFDYYTLKNEKLDECWELEEKIPEHKFDAETLNSVYDIEYDFAKDSYERCLNWHTRFLMIWEILRVVALVSIFLTIISWRIDMLKKN